MQDFRELRVWQEAIELTASVYAVSRTLPSEERFGLVSQMRRSATSIASNVAEGCGCETSQDFARFLRMAYGFACELETHCRVAIRLNLGNAAELGAVARDSEEIRKMLAGLKAAVLNA